MTSTLTRRALTVSDVKAQSGRGDNVVYDALASGELAGVQAPRSWVILQSDLDSWIKRGMPRGIRRAS